MEGAGPRPAARIREGPHCHLASRCRKTTTAGTAGGCQPCQRRDLARRPAYGTRGRPMASGSCVPAADAALAAGPGNVTLRGKPWPRGRVGGGRGGEQEEGGADMRAENGKKEEEEEE